MLPVKWKDIDLFRDLGVLILAELEKENEEMFYKKLPQSQPNKMSQASPAPLVKN